MALVERVSKMDEVLDLVSKFGSGGVVESECWESIETCSLLNMG